MKTWLTLRLSDDNNLAAALAADTFTDSAGETTSVTESVAVVVPDEVRESLRALLADAQPALAKRLRLSLARHVLVAEETMGRAADGALAVK